MLKRYVFHCWKNTLEKNPKKMLEFSPPYWFMFSWQKNELFHEEKNLTEGKDDTNNRTKIHVKFTVLLFSSGSCERTKTYSIDVGFFFQSMIFFASFLNILINKINMSRHLKMKRVLADIFLRKKIDVYSYIFRLVFF